MLCENCGQRKAKIHLVRVINGNCVEENICGQCAEKKMPFRDAEQGVKMSFSLEGIMDMGDVLKNLLFPMWSEQHETQSLDFKCPHCGKEISPDELLGINDGIVGEQADDEPVFPPLDAPAEPVSEIRSEDMPGTQVVKPDLTIQNALDAEEKELSELAKELTAALREERYERAAEIRDRVAVLKKIMIGEEPKEE